MNKQNLSDREGRKDTPGHGSGEWWVDFTPDLLFGLKSTYSSACVEQLAVEIKLKRRKTRSGTPRTWLSCLWIICSLKDICCCVFRLKRYQPMTFCSNNSTGVTGQPTHQQTLTPKKGKISHLPQGRETYFSPFFENPAKIILVDSACIVVKAEKKDCDRKVGLALSFS